MPCSADALQSASPDFTFAGGNIANTDNTGKPTPFQTNDSDVLYILRNVNPADPTKPNSLNPRQIPFFHAKDAAANGPGIGTDGVFRDPWGNPYIITLDLDDNNKCREYGFYYPLNGDVSGQVMIWSFGPDTIANPKDAYKAGANKDNVLSWE